MDTSKYGIAIITRFKTRISRNPANLWSNFFIVAYKSNLKRGAISQLYKSFQNLETYISRRNGRKKVA